MFIFAILGFGTLYYWLAGLMEPTQPGYLETLYHVLAITFLQPLLDFPHSLPLQILWFLMPVVGIGILAQGLADFGVALFNRRTRNKEWQMAVASTYRDHIILIGLGHLGYRVVTRLHDIGKEMVVVELNPKLDLLEHVQSLAIPVLVEDATRERVLEAAGVRRATTLILCTQNDSLNLEIAVKARNLNPDIRVVIRIFDDDFAQSLNRQFGFKALSATGMAAPVFASSAADVDITPPITIDGIPNSLARMEVSKNSMLAGHSIDQIENHYNISVVMICHQGVSDSHPAGSLIVSEKDTLAVLGTPESVSLLVQDNQ